MSVQITYRDTSPFSKKDSTLTVTDKQAFISEAQLKQDLDVPNYATMEQNFWVLNGTHESFPDEPVNAPFGVWSYSMSGENGAFSAPIILVRTFTEKHSSVGISFEFQRYTNDYCNHLSVKWYSDDVLLFEKEYQPDNATYYCKQNVELYNKVVITFYSMNKAGRYLKIANIDDGVIRIFGDSDLMNVKVVEEISPISEELPIDTLDFTLNKGDIEFMFQKKQPTEVYHNGSLIGCFFIESSSRLTKTQYKVSAEDYIGILDKSDFMGGIYTAVPASEIVAAIFEGETIPYEMETALKNTLLSGYIKICTKREALAQVAFALGAIIDTARTRKVLIRKVDTENTASVDGDRIFMGGSIDTGDIVTAVEIKEHSYVQNNETQELFSGQINGTELITFSEPKHSLAISGGTITESDTNYAIITASGDVVLSGKGYTHATKTIRKSNPNITYGEKQNVIKFEETTLISGSNSAEIIENVYNYYMKNKTLKCDFVLNGEETSDTVNIDTEFAGTKKGMIKSLDLDLKNKLIGKAEIQIE